MTTYPESAGVYPDQSLCPPARRHALVLAVLAIAFAGRVVVQLAQRVHPVGWLPSFEQWQSGALPYGVLLGGQLAILAAQCAIVLGVIRDRGPLGRGGRRAIAGFAWAYLAVMVVRMVVGFTEVAQGSWFDAPLPTAFHLLLATFLLVRLDEQRRRDPSRSVLRGR